MTREESWNAFIDELRAYVQEHHHFPNKHTNLLSRVKYVRKKINGGHTGRLEEGAVPGGGGYEGLEDMDIKK